MVEIAAVVSGDNNISLGGYLAGDQNENLYGSQFFPGAVICDTILHSDTTDLSISLRLTGQLLMTGK